MRTRCTPALSRPHLCWDISSHVFARAVLRPIMSHEMSYHVLMQFVGRIRREQSKSSSYYCHLGGVAIAQTADALPASSSRGGLRMLAAAGVKPSDLEVAEVHDCFEPWTAVVRRLVLFESSLTE